LLVWCLFVKYKQNNLDLDVDFNKELKLQSPKKSFPGRLLGGFWVVDKKTHPNGPCSGKYIPPKFVSPYKILSGVVLKKIKFCFVIPVSFSRSCSILLGPACLPSSPSKQS